MIAMYGIDYLNSKVISIIQKFETHDDTSDDLLRVFKRENPEAIEAVRKGDIVYHPCNQFVVGMFILYIGFAFSGAPSWAHVFGSVFLMFFAVDFYGAVLHVLLDTPAFIGFPIIGPACLEFQWHHAIPTDIVSKPFGAVLGDLNLVATIHLTWVYLASYYFDIELSAILCMCAAKLSFAYIGQFSHKQAHTLKVISFFILLCREFFFHSAVICHLFQLLFV